MENGYICAADQNNVHRILLINPRVEWLSGHIKRPRPCSQQSRSYSVCKGKRNSCWCKGLLSYPRSRQRYPSWISVPAVVHCKIEMSWQQWPVTKIHACLHNWIFIHQCLDNIFQVLAGFMCILHCFCSKAHNFQYKLFECWTSVAFILIILYYSSS